MEMFRKAPAAFSFATGVPDVSRAIRGGIPPAVATATLLSSETCFLYFNALDQSDWRGVRQPLCVVLAGSECHEKSFLWTSLQPTKEGISPFNCDGQEVEQRRGTTDL